MLYTHPSAPFDDTLPFYASTNNGNRMPSQTAHPCRHTCIENEVLAAWNGHVSLVLTPSAYLATDAM